MGSLGDGVKKVLLAGIGTAAVTAEKSKEVLDKMAERGEAAVEQGKVLNQELRHNIKKTVKENVNVSVSTVSAVSPVCSTTSSTSFVSSSETAASRS